MAPNVNIRRVKPTVPRGTRARRMPTTPVSFEERSALSTAERLRNDIFPKQGSLVTHGGDYEPEPKSPEEVRAKARQEQAERGSERRSELARLRVAARTPAGEARERRAARQGVESPLKRAERVESKIKKDKAEARKTSVAKSAERQRAAGVRSPVVTTQEREDRAKRLERVKRGMLGTPVPKATSGASSNKARLRRSNRPNRIGGITAWNRRFNPPSITGGRTPIKPFGGVFPSLPGTVKRVATVQPRPKPSWNDLPSEQARKVGQSGRLGGNLWRWSGKVR